MENLEMSEREKKVFQTGLFDDLTVQDAFTIISLYAAQLDIDDGKEVTDKIILTFLSKDKLFEEDHSDTLDRINKFSISMNEVNPLNALKKAVEVLTPELRHKSFTLAAQICKATQEKRIESILGRLGSKLRIEKEIIESIIDSTTKQG